MSSETQWERAELKKKLKEIMIENLAHLEKYIKLQI